MNLGRFELFLVRNASFFWNGGSMMQFAIASAARNSMQFVIAIAILLRRHNHLIHSILTYTRCTQRSFAVTLT